MTRTHKKIVATFLSLVIATFSASCAVIDDSVENITAEINNQINTAQSQVEDKIDATKNELTYTAKGYADKATASIITTPKATINVFLDDMVNGNMEDALSMCVPDSSAYEILKTFQSDYFTEMFAASLFTTPEYLEEARKNEKLIQVGKSCSSKLCTGYEIQSEQIYDDTAEYFVSVKINNFDTDRYLDDAIDSMINDVSSGEKFDDLQAFFNENGGDDAAMYSVAEKLFYENMDSIFEALDKTMNNTYNYSDAYAYITLTKQNGKWMIYDFQ